MTPVLLLIALAVAGVGPATTDNGALAVTDLGAYRAALLGKGSGRLAEVGFRELWENPKAFEGRRLAVRGKVQRLFSQEAYGTFPPLVEAWIVSPAGNPFCLVFPRDSKAASTRPGQEIRFGGTFLRLIRYESGDGPRLAPLVVGPGPPEGSAGAKPKRAPTGHGFTSVDWTLGIGAALLVTLVLVSQHLRQPLPRPDRDRSEPTSWLAQHAGGPEGGSIEGGPNAPAGELSGNPVFHRREA